MSQSQQLQFPFSSSPISSHLRYSRSADLIHFACIFALGSEYLLKITPNIISSHCNLEEVLPAELRCHPGPQPQYRDSILEVNVRSHAKGARTHRSCIIDVSVAIFSCLGFCK
ncbi:hypothetical protein M501DRAFT_958198 [Patellaria atrata CBS 101060]|uniref:Uncharacterized protein n=1 Tax=Patellaria atrata CBS 101060 TaxID=1346257 RepID=A0A9P4S872_9PEZI|nr:hypothetical protein M501DRAFT_958198 [Patellaria atrata CBS 101060]